MKHTPLIGILLCFFIINLPLAYAKELSIVRISGRDGANGYYGYQDSVNITVRAALEDDPAGIQPDQLRLYIDEERNEVFDSCKTVSGHLTECRFDRDFTPYPGEHDYEIRLYTDEDKYQEEAAAQLVKTSTFTQDLIPPTIESFSLGPERTTDGKLTGHIKAHDRAFDSENDASCSGIARIGFYISADPTAPVHTMLLDRKCSDEKDIAFTLSTYPNGTRLPDDEYAVTARVYDAIGQTAQSEPVFVVYDTGAPEVRGDQLHIVDSEGREVQFVRTQETRSFEVRIPVLDSNLAHVTADLSKLTDLPGMQAKLVDATEENIAIWRNVRLKNFKTCEIKFTATDSFGQSTVRVVDCSLRIDDEGPELVSLKTDRVDAQGKMLLGAETTVTAVVKDAISGISNTTLFLDARGFLGKDRLPPDTCRQAGDQYTCTWMITPLQGSGERALTLTSSSTDRAGNAFKPYTPPIVRVDDTQPRFGEIDLRVIKGIEGRVAPVVTQGATFELSVPVTGHDPAQVVANLSAMGLDVLPMQCGEKTCSVVATATLSGPRDDVITFTARTRSGNPGRKNYTLTTFGLMNGTPNYWTTQVACSPSLIDRQVASLIEYKMFCAVTLQNPNAYLYPVGYDFEGIRNCDVNAGKYVSEINLLNVHSGAKHPTFEITLFSDDYNIDSLSFSCNMSIFTASREGGKALVNVNPEEEKVWITTGFYNQPLGELYKNLDNQVKQAVDEAQKNLKWVDKLNKFFQMASKMCQLKQTIASILQGVQYISFALQNIRDRTPDPTTKAALRGPVRGICHVEEKWEKAAYDQKNGIFKFIDQMCVFVECRAGSEKNDPKAGKFLNDVAGGVPWCKDIKELLSFGVKKGTDIPPVNTREKYSKMGAAAPFDVKNSLILSSACLCLPGIIYNLNKLREIKCQKALCMKREVRDRGLPPSVCADLEGYLTCNFVVGEIFSLFPIAKLWNQMTDLLATVIANPLELITLYSGLKCQGFCKSDGQAVNYKLCAFPKTLSKIGDAFGSIKALKDVGKQFDMTPSSGSCDQLEEYQ